MGVKLNRVISVHRRVVVRQPRGRRRRNRRGRDAARLSLRRCLGRRPSSRPRRLDLCDVRGVCGVGRAGGKSEDAHQYFRGMPVLVVHRGHVQRRGGERRRRLAQGSVAECDARHSKMVRRPRREAMDQSRRRLRHGQPKILPQRDAAVDDGVAAEIAPLQCRGPGRVALHGDFLTTSISTNDVALYARLRIRCSRALARRRDAPPHLDAPLALIAVAALDDVRRHV
mmetsp:Transcript_32029/g.107840  ORF Transcript_32029/g.107840 Transcript_32029/m.107840 type:complete len:227 (-) Transcript_32029:165-845(-)